MLIGNQNSQLERCESGRIGLTANELTWETGSEGSNPSLSADVKVLFGCGLRRRACSQDVGRAPLVTAHASEVPEHAVG